MSSHLSREDLLGFHLQLLETEEHEAMSRHLESCKECREALEEVRIMSASVDASLPPAESQEISTIPLTQRLADSSVTPALVMVVSLLLSALPEWTWGAGSWAPLVIGALVVMWWLHGVVSRVEARWRPVGEINWSAAIEEGGEEQLRAFEGVRLSVIQSLHRARSQVSQVLVISGAIFIVSGALTLLAGLWAPAVTASVTAGRPLLLPGALAGGVLMGGVVWASLRLVRLSRAIADLVRTVADSQLSLL